jgi:probable rRNA maturation factor
MPNAASANIRFHFLSRAALRSRTAIKEVVSKILADHGRVPEAINYIFCDDEYVRAINASYLKHDFYTDIITFDLSNEPDRVLADIFISVDRVRDNAKAAGSGMQEELVRVILHGALHLSGFRDKRASEIRAMREAEERYLAVLR